MSCHPAAARCFVQVGLGVVFLLVIVESVAAVTTRCVLSQFLNVDFGTTVLDHSIQECRDSRRT